MKFNRNIILLVSCAFSVVSANAQSLKTKNSEWHLGPNGIDYYKTKDHFFKNKDGKEVVVAIIDTGIDTLHTALRPNLWRNADHAVGWNYLGSKNNPEHYVSKDSYEYERVYIKYKKEFAHGKRPAFYRFKARNRFKVWEVSKEISRYQSPQKLMHRGVSYFMSLVPPHQELLLDYFKGDFNGHMLEQAKIDSANKPLLTAVGMMRGVYYHINKDTYVKDLPAKIDSMLNYLEIQTPVFPDTVRDYRKPVLQDNPDDLNDLNYGNTNVMGGTGMHGTHVTGIIAAIARQNEAEGAVGKVKFMVLRAVPDGDEHDKDVALAIRYAVDHGASVVNMSFGKPVSPNQKWVQEAIKYADKKGVLLVHSAGNENLNIDTNTVYPNANFSGNKSFMNIGASDNPGSKEHLKADFSNYGKKRVEVFAPGVNIYATYPKQSYGTLSGTSMAAPVVSGIAIALKSYYPNLSSHEIRQLLMDSVKKYVTLKELSITSGVVNMYEAFRLAEERYGIIK